MIHGDGNEKLEQRIVGKGTSVFSMESVAEGGGRLSQNVHKKINRRVDRNRGKRGIGGTLLSWRRFGIDVHRRTKPSYVANKIRKREGGQAPQNHIG